MSGTNKEPGVYIYEQKAFPNSVVRVATAVPAFIGYTEKAENKGNTLVKRPWRISSMSEFIHFFGGAPEDKFVIDVFPSKDKNIKNLENSDFCVGNEKFQLLHKSPRYFLYYSMILFFKNGGGACYIVSIGDYTAGTIERSKLESAFDELLKEQEPTMVIIPDAMSLSEEDCIALQHVSIEHCGSRMKNRFAILDIYDGYKDRITDIDCIDQFRNALNRDFLSFAAAYYPWLHTSIVPYDDMNFCYIANIDAADETGASLVKVLKMEVNQSNLSDGKKSDYSAIIETIPSALKAAGDLATTAVSTGTSAKLADDKAKVKENVEKSAAYANTALDLSKLLKTISLISPLYNEILASLQNKLNLLPPAAAMAGVYSAVDNTRGVWKAPANIALAAVVKPSVDITHVDQEDLNVTTAGKSINSIRSFIGEGTLVWGARTLDGNSLDWRYINVRRTMIMLEESIRLATKLYVFEPNVDGTWVTIKCMISKFLNDIWKSGGLVGATTEDAFSVYVGLGETMTPEDILEGILRVTILVAINRPSEFIEITFEQQMQKP